MFSRDCVIRVSIDAERTTSYISDGVLTLVWRSWLKFKYTRTHVYCHVDAGLPHCRRAILPCRQKSTAPPTAPPPTNSSLGTPASPRRTVKWFSAAAVVGFHITVHSTHRQAGRWRRTLIFFLLSFSHTHTNHIRFTNRFIYILGFLFFAPQSSSVFPSDHFSSFAHINTVRDQLRYSIKYNIVLVVRVDHISSPSSSSSLGLRP